MRSKALPQAVRFTQIDDLIPIHPPINPGRYGHAITHFLERDYLGPGQTEPVGIRGLTSSVRGIK